MVAEGMSTNEDTTDGTSAKGAEHAFVRASWVNVIGNLLKIAIEGSVGLAFGSFALVADAGNSLGDLLASVVVLVGGRFRFVDPDTTHPHGHEQIEPLAALVHKEDLKYR